MATPRLGLRSQLLLSLGLLSVVAFVPLYFALAGLTRVTLERTRDDAARALARAVAGRLGDHVDDPTRLRDVASASLDTVSRDGVVALRVAMGGPAASAPLELGHPATLEVLRAHPVAFGERTFRGHAAGLGPFVATEVATPRAVVQVALRVGDDASRAAPLLRLLAFYTAGFAVILLTLSYTLLTRLIVRPVGALAVATARVAERRERAEGDDPYPSLRLLGPATAGAKEVAELGEAIAATTGLLVERERSLAAKVRQLEAARADLLAARDAIVRSERLASVGRLAAGLAHEVGNPLAALLGLEDVLLLGELDAESRDLVQRMKRETERMHAVMRDLLEFARAGEEPTSARDASCAIADVAGEVVALLAPQKALRDLELSLAVEPALPAVRLAGTRLQQVLVNLVLNAADAIGEGGGSSIVLRAERAGLHRVRVAVEDDGPGIPAAIRETLFEPFVTTKEPGKGTGLGLAVCRGIVDGAHGTLTVGTGPSGRGTVFTIELPTVDAPPPPRSVAPPASLA